MQIIEIKNVKERRLFHLSVTFDVTLIYERDT
jgi:hypothetical protein